MRSRNSAAGGTDLVMRARGWLTCRALGRRARSAAIRRIRRPCSGPASVDSAPAPTSAAAVEDCMWPPSTATVVIATTSGSCVAVNSASAWRSSPQREHARGTGASPACRGRRGTARRRSPASRRPTQLANSASTSSRMPLTTKKNGTKTPNATAVSFESNSGISRARSDLPGDQAGGEPAEQQVEPEVGGEQREREHEHDDPAHGELRARLDRPLEHRHRVLGRAHREHGDAHRERDERDQDQRVVQRALRREHQRQQQDRPELPDRPGREQVAAELGLQLARVREDRDQRADRGRRQRGARRRRARRRRRAAARTPPSV